MYDYDGDDESDGTTESNNLIGYVLETELYADSTQLNNSVADCIWGEPE